MPCVQPKNANIFNLLFVVLLYQLLYIHIYITNKYIYIYNKYIYTYIYRRTESNSEIVHYSQIVHHNPRFNLFILQNNSFDSQGSEINKSDIFLRFDILSFTKTFFLLLLYIQQAKYFSQNELFLVNFENLEFQHLFISVLQLPKIQPILVDINKSIRVTLIFYRFKDHLLNECM